MKKILLIISCFMNIYYYRKYKNIQEAYQLDSVDIETKEDQLHKMGLCEDTVGNIHEKEKSYL